MCVLVPCVCVACVTDAPQVLDALILRELLPDARVILVGDVELLPQLRRQIVPLLWEGSEKKKKMRDVSDGTTLHSTRVGNPLSSVYVPYQQLSLKIKN